MLQMMSKKLGRKHQALQCVLVRIYPHSACSLKLTCVATTQTHPIATDASKPTALWVKTQIEWSFHPEKLKYRLDNVEEARKKDQKYMDSMMEMILQLQNENSRKRKLSEDVGWSGESLKGLKKRTCIEEF
jgi:hypothetical protein